MNARRLPLPLLLIAVLLVAVVAGDPDDTATARPAVETESVAVPPPGAMSAAWFCPGPPETMAIDQEVLTLTNVGAVDTSVVVTVFPDDGTEPVVQDVEIAALSIAHRDRPSLGPVGPVTVEAFSRDVVVESGYATADALATNACATSSGTEWHFAAGTTDRGTEQHLVIFNPLGTDAKVDVTLPGSDGVEQAEALQSLDVPRRSRVTVRVHERAIRTERVAVDIEATIGQVVVEQTIVFGPDSDFSGVTRSSGALAAADRWMFADGTTTSGATQVVALSNPGDADAAVTAFASAGLDVVVDPVEITVPRQGVVWLTLGACDEVTVDCLAIPPDVSYALEIEANPNTPVVAEALTRMVGSALGSGAATTIGSTEPASRWIVPRTTVPGTSSMLAVANPDIRPVTFDVAVVHDGVADRPAELQGIEVGPSQRVGIDLGAVLAGLVAADGGADAALVVTAAGPVVVERSVSSATDLSRAVAVPARDE